LVDADVEIHRHLQSAIVHDMEKVGYVLLLAVTACAGGAGSGGNGAGGAAGAGSSGSGAGSSGSAGNFDAPPACVAAGTVEAPASPVSGSVVGNRLRAAICYGGAKAYVEVTQGSASVASQTLLIFSFATSGDPQTDFRIELPTEAVQGRMNGLLGMTGPTPGTYSSESGCGALSLFVTLPVPTDLVCSGSAACPPGCVLQGPVSGPVCSPVTPGLGYAANAVGNCVYGTEIPHGSWSLIVTSVDAYAPDVAAPTKRFVAHGTLTAELLNDDGSDDSVQLSVAF
jgi:hypothetical protein